MADTLEYWGGTLVHHGPENDRIYLLKVDRAALPGLRQRVDALCREKGYGKVIAKVPQSLAETFAAWGYHEEARVPGLYGGAEDGVFMSVFRGGGANRAREPHPDEVARVVDRLGQEGAVRTPPPPSPEWEIRSAGEADVEEMAALYEEVFPSYPFPITQPGYLLQTLKASVRYTGAWRKGRLLALASVEMDPAGNNAEMTDFATHPQGRGQGLAFWLLRAGEEIARREGLLTLYTIARASSVGMNLTFLRAGYRCSGTLVHNTWIFGRLESMNVWYRSLGPEKP